IVVWALHKIGKALITLFDALAAVTVVFLALWGLAKTTAWLVKQGGDALADQPERASRVGVVAAVGVALPRPPPPGGHCRADGMALRRSDVLRQLGRPVAAGVVATLDHLRPQAAPLAARLWPERHRHHHPHHGQPQPPRAPQAPPWPPRVRCAGAQG